MEHRQATLDTVHATTEREHERLTGLGRVLIMVYLVLAAAATFRSFYQIVTKFDEAPLAYSLSALSGVVYIVATIALMKRSGVWRRVAFWAILFELIGVVVVGVLSIATPKLFAHPSVWSWFGMGYGFIPLVLPVLGLIWLARDRNAEAATPGAVVAIGKFEGVHRGHQHILERLHASAIRVGTTQRPARTVVFTFTNNPLSLLAPAACPKPVMSPRQRRETMEAFGIDEVDMVDFDERMANLSPEEFVRTYLVGRHRAKHVIVGSDFRFGKGAAGTPEVLRELGATYGFTVEVVADVVDAEHGRVSSTLIREALDAGDVVRAARLLGRPHRVRGVVTHGDARGRDLGFPTANVGPAAGEGRIEGLIPADGIYAGTVTVAGTTYDAAISVGNNPTFTPDADSRVEAFIIDFDGDIYGEAIEVAFTERIRDMLPFESVDALIDEMRLDVERVRALRQQSAKPVE